MGEDEMKDNEYLTDSFKEDVEKNIKRWTVSGECDLAFDWKHWKDKIPFINFPAHFKVKIVPPYNAAMVRFEVMSPSDNGTISVYLDCHGQLADFVDEDTNQFVPYWEAYPITNGDESQEETRRFEMEDVDGLMKALAEELEYRASKQVSK